MCKQRFFSQASPRIGCLTYVFRLVSLFQVNKYQALDLKSSACNFGRGDAVCYDAQTLWIDSVSLVALVTRFVKENVHVRNYCGCSDHTLGFGPGVFVHDGRIYSRIAGHCASRDCAATYAWSKFIAFKYAGITIWGRSLAGP